MHCLRIWPGYRNCLPKPLSQSCPRYPAHRQIHWQIWRTHSDLPAGCARSITPAICSSYIATWVATYRGWLQLAHCFYRVHGAYTKISWACTCEECTVGLHGHGDHTDLWDQESFLYIGKLHIFDYDAPLHQITWISLRTSLQWIRQDGHTVHSVWSMSSHWQLHSQSQLVVQLRPPLSSMLDIHKRSVRLVMLVGLGDCDLSENKYLLLNVIAAHPQRVGNLNVGVDNF